MKLDIKGIATSVVAWATVYAIGWMLALAIIAGLGFLGIYWWENSHLWDSLSHIRLADMSVADLLIVLLIIWIFLQ